MKTKNLDLFYNAPAHDGLIYLLCKSSFTMYRSKSIHILYGQLNRIRCHTLSSTINIHAINFNLLHSNWNIKGEWGAKKLRHQWACEWMVFMYTQYIDFMYKWGHPYIHSSKHLFRVYIFRWTKGMICCT